MSVELRIRHRGAEITAFPGDIVTIGSGDEADVTVGHPGVSRAHAEVSFADGAWMLRDIGSTNGSFVDGTRVDQITLLGPTTVLLGHETEGEALDLVPSGGTPPPGAMAPLRAVGPASARRIEIALWIIAAAAVAGVAIAIAALVGG